MDETPDLPSLEELLQAFLAGLDSSSSPSTGEWLREQIAAAILTAERETDLVSSIANVDDYHDDKLTPARRLEIALQVAYHQLVAVPRMWAHVSRFWRTHEQIRVRLMDTVTNEPIELPWHSNDDVSSVAFDYISRFVDQLEEHYGLPIRQHGWLSSQERPHDE